MFAVILQKSNVAVVEAGPDENVHRLKSLPFCPNTLIFPSSLVYLYEPMNNDTKGVSPAFVGNEPVATNWANWVHS